ncbi:hypothetical protein B296_00008286, partial [Ensete ventricosum]
MEGWGGLYSGLKPSLMGTAASQFVPLYLKMMRWWSYPGNILLLLSGFFLTHTQAERKIMEARKEAILREYAGTTYMEHELVKLDLMKPRPYGTFRAVSFLAGGIGKIGGNCGNISFISCK